VAAGSLGKLPSEHDPPPRHRESAKNWSNDTFRLAAVALRAAIRNEADLLALLPAASASPQRSVDRAHANA
jgi:hypothetical protein